jgi:hypothetical protein
MENYEKMVKQELDQWEKQILKRSSLLNRTVKKAQYKVNRIIPEKVHEVITSSVKSMVKATLTGSEFVSKRKPLENLPLEKRDGLLDEKLKSHRRTAVVEGAGTGAGGILFGLADFPLLLSIKMKFLFDAACCYGYDVRDYRERLYILHVFQLAFSSDKVRRETYLKITNWEKTLETFPVKHGHLESLDWQAFQQNYRDHIDFIKMLQLMPGLGAVVGAYANYNLLDELGETAKNCYRLRLIKDKKP